MRANNVKNQCYMYRLCKDRSILLTFKEFQNKSLLELSTYCIHKLQKHRIVLAKFGNILLKSFSVNDLSHIGHLGVKSCSKYSPDHSV